MVRTRVLFGFLLIVGMVGIAALDAWLTQQTVRDPLDYLLHGALLTVVLAVLVSWGVVEMGRLCRAAGHEPAVGWCCLATFILMILPWVSITPLVGDRSSLAGWEVTGKWLGVSVFVGVIWILLRARAEGAIANMAITTWLIVYVGFLGSFEARLRIDMTGPVGAWLVLYHLAVVKFADIGAYFTGIGIGRHRIVPTISPNKTLEGFLGGLAAAVIVAVAFSWLGGIMMPWYDIPSAGAWLSAGQAVIFGLSMGFVGQLGDLIESLIKRDAGTKDSGSAVPAFGGVLDVIDSPLLTAPVAWWLLTGWLS